MKVGDAEFEMLVTLGVDPSGNPLPEDVDVREFNTKLVEAMTMLDEVVEEALKVLVANAAKVMVMDPVQTGVPEDFKGPGEFPCRTVRDELKSLAIHVIEETYQLSENEPWFLRD